MKVAHSTGHVSANTKPHQLCWGDWGMGTAWCNSTQPLVAWHHCILEGTPMFSAHKHVYFSTIAIVVFPGSLLNMWAESVVSSSNLEATPS